MALDKFKLDTNDISVFMSQPPQERRYASRSFVSNFLKSKANSETRNLYGKLVQMALSDCDTHIQEEVADRISQSPNLSSDIAVQIVINKLTTADWLLKNFSQFEEQDLLAILLSGSCREYEQIADRSDLTSLTFDYICQYGCEKAVSILLKNQTSKLTINGARTLLARYAMAPAIIDALSKRRDFPPEVLEEMENPDLTATGTETSPSGPQSFRKLDTQLTATKEQELLTKLNPEWSPSKKRDAISQLTDDGRLTHTLLCLKLLEADLEFFTIGLACKSHTPECEIRAAIQNADTGKLKEIMRKAGTPTYLQPAVKTIIQQLQNKSLLSTNQRQRLQHIAMSKIEQLYHLEPHQNPETLIETITPQIRVRKLN